MAMNKTFWCFVTLPGEPATTGIAMLLRISNNFSIFTNPQFVSVVVYPIGGLAMASSQSASRRAINDSNPSRCRSRSRQVINPDHAETFSPLFPNKPYCSGRPILRGPCPGVQGVLICSNCPWSSRFTHFRSELSNIVGSSSITFGRLHGGRVCYLLTVPRVWAKEFGGGCLREAEISELCSPSSC